MHKPGACFASLICEECEHEDDNCSVYCTKPISEAQRAARILGAQGGKTKNSKMTKKERTEWGRKAAKARWKKSNP